LHTILVQEEFASPCVIVVGDVLLGANLTTLEDAKIFSAY
jgi:hypothetical protein